jgi:hypothetical protein
MPRVAAPVRDNPCCLFAGDGVTKPRPPLSIDGALGRIAGQLPGDWNRMAEVVGRSASQVRRWGDHDAPDQIPLPAAIALDIAYQRAGGADRPLFETYKLQLDVAREEAFADEIELLQRLRTLIRESAEAQEKLVLASLPSASTKDRRAAIKELEDVQREVTCAIAQLVGIDAPPDPPP